MLLLNRRPGRPIRPPRKLHLLSWILQTLNMALFRTSTSPIVHLVLRRFLRTLLPRRPHHPRLLNQKPAHYHFYIHPTHIQSCLPRLPYTQSSLLRWLRQYISWPLKSFPSRNMSFHGFMGSIQKIRFNWLSSRPEREHSEVCQGVSAVSQLSKLAAISPEVK